jgi:putative nucleotidyltransferase with HDIG domain
MKKYTYREIVKNVEKIVERECKKPKNIFGYAFWKHHILSVVKYAKLLAKRLKADKEIVELAALLHDIGVVQGDKANHHLSGAKEAEKILKKFNYPQGKIEKIKHCIFAHRGSKSIKRKTIEAECIASADALAHFEEIPQLFESAFIRFKLNPEEGKQWLLAKLERDWKKLIPEAKAMVKARYQAIKQILK